MEHPYQYDLRPCKQIVVGALNGKRFDSVLEVGTQWGENLYAIREKFPDKKLVGVDIDKETLENAKTITNLDLRDGDVFNLPFEEKEFDVVFTNALFCMLEPNYVERALRQLIRIAKKQIILVELGTSELVGRVHGGRTGANWVELLQKYGFKAKKRKLTEEEWNVSPWKEYGYLIVCSV